MKNPMTLQEKHQAIDDIEAGYDMQIRSCGNTEWIDRPKETAGCPPDFYSFEYRRKPESMKCFVNFYEKEEPCAHSTLKKAIDGRYENGFIRTVPMIEDTSKPEPGPEEKSQWNETVPLASSAMTSKNPWRDIIKDKWPECEPKDAIELLMESGKINNWYACDINWMRTDAVKWRYADE